MAKIRIMVNEIPKGYKIKGAPHHIDWCYSPSGAYQFRKSYLRYWDGRYNTTKLRLEDVLCYHDAKAGRYAILVRVK